MTSHYLLVAKNNSFLDARVMLALTMTKAMCAYPLCCIPSDVWSMEPFHARPDPVLDETWARKQAPLLRPNLSGPMGRTNLPPLTQNNYLKHL